MICGILFDAASYRSLIVLTFECSLFIIATTIQNNCIPFLFKINFPP